MSGQCQWLGTQALRRVVPQQMEPHEHCYRCYSFSLCDRSAGDEDSCDFTRCKCGQVFHGCKALEHEELCSHLVVRCVNESFGCPKKLVRKDMTHHLERCPASVVVCVVEWNRWPIVSRAKTSNVPFRQPNPNGCEGQLDFDLLLRDQRLLSSLAKIPRRARLVLRNSLTKRFPALPLPSAIFRNDNNREKSNARPVLIDESALVSDGDVLTFVGGKSAELSGQMRRWQQDLDHRLKGIKLPLRYWEYPELERGNVHKHCSTCFDATCKRTLQVSDPEDTSCALTLCRWKCGAVLHACKQSEHLMVCPLYTEPDEFEWMHKGVSAASRNRKAKKAAAAKRTAPPPPPMKVVDFLVDPGTTAKGIPSPPPPPLRRRFTTSQMPLSLRLETRRKQESKPTAMFTFVCGQSYRRDEYGWHHKTVHDDVQGGMDNWMEHRCPLAYYGCGFSVRRLHPSRRQQRVVFNAEVDSFGLKTILRTETPQQEPSRFRLTDLPYEILCEIVKRLDSFSICHLAVTCVHLRQVCSSLLETRGCVSPKWQRIEKENGERSWNISSMRWFFSTATDPISDWVHETTDTMVSKHLEVCPYNVRVEGKTVDKLVENKWADVVKSLSKSLGPAND